MPVPPSKISLNPDMTGKRVFVFDSGVGGLPYLEALRLRIPGIPCHFAADRAGFPYGRKTRAEVRSLVLDRVERIAGRFSPRLVVLACNTASQAALEAARTRFPEISFVGTVPAVKPAAESTRTGTIVVLSTERAAVDPYLDTLVERWAQGVRVLRIGAQDLVEFVERDFLDASEAERLAACRAALEPVLDSGADRIVLACTHFLHVADYIARAAGSGVRIVDSRAGVARRAAEVLSGGAASSPAVPAGSVPTGSVPARGSGVAGEEYGGLYATGEPGSWTGLDRFAELFGLSFEGAL